MHSLAWVAWTPEAALSAAQGLTATQLMRGVAFGAAVLAIVLLLWVEFVSRRRLRRETYHWLLLVGLLILPAVTLLATTTVLFEETKTVESCASCHVMQPFVADLRNAASETLAARHARNKWIADQQCYTCHTTYGVHGTLAAKRDGLLHWLRYTTGRWEEPIQFRGNYPNANCLACHGDTPTYIAFEGHKEVAAELGRDEMGCVDCHGPPHPPADERPGSARP